MKTVSLVAFDLDDTLAPSKSNIGPAMAAALKRLLDHLPVCIISGGGFKQFECQVLAQLPADTKFEELHLMPTCGTRYFRYRDGWHQVYAHDLSETEKQQASKAIKAKAIELGLWEPDEKVTGKRIEDRGSQLTYSALGQQALVADKRLWDPSGAKREELRAALAAELPNLDVRSGGSTSVDITKRGIDKAYGIAKLATMAKIPLDQMLFIGDRLQPGGNDYPVRSLGVTCHEVSGPEQTLEFLSELMTNWEATNDHRL